MVDTAPADGPRDVRDVETLALGMQRVEAGPWPPMAEAPASRLSFGPFSLKNYGEALYRHDELVRVGSRARQILAALAAKAGQVVSKADLMAEVWPDTTVVENNLTVHIAALRQALGDGRDGVQYIVNVPGRGYRFVAPVLEERDVDGASVPPPGVSAPTNLPVRLRPAVGLSKAIGDVTAKLRSSGLVTVAGPPGVGKTTLGLHVAQAERWRYPDGAWLVDLASLREPEHIPAAVAATMRIELGSGDPTTALVLALSRSKTLLLLDNCEHLIEAVADLVAMMGRQCPDVVLLATSREPLRVSGEAVYGLAPLEMPPNVATLSAREALAYPAVQLFVELVTAATNDFTLSDQDAVVAASICRQLDGLPLAIEFASALVAAFGLPGLAARLDDRSKLMQTDMRGASDRHRTLTTALDWSYGLLDAAEQAALQRLAVFAGGFTLEGAAAVISLQDLGEVGGLLARLHAKSLITSDITSKDLRFRLLATTRAYALEKLELAGDASGDGQTELQITRRRHALYCRAMLEAAELDWERCTTLEWLSKYGEHIHDVRAALDWCFLQQGDTNVGVDLTVVSTPLWFQLSLVGEFLKAVDWAIDRLDSRSSHGRYRLMQLYAARSGAVRQTLGPRAEAAQNATIALDLAEALGAEDYQFRLLWAFCAEHIMRGDYAHALAFAQRMGASLGESPDRPAEQIYERNMAQVLHFMGRHVEARTFAEAASTGRTTNSRMAYFTPARLDQEVVVHAIMARILWIQGYADQALSHADEAVARARHVGHPFSISYSLAAGACPVAMWRGDVARAAVWTGQLVENSKIHSLRYYEAWGRCYETAVDLADGARTFNSTDPLRRILGITREPRLHDEMGTVSTHLVTPGTLQRAKQRLSGWCAPEIQRVEAESLIADGRLGEAESMLVSALDTARTQQALAWELRISISLARLLRDLGRSAAGRVLLNGVCDRFTEGHKTADFLDAEALALAL